MLCVCSLYYMAPPTDIAALARYLSQIMEPGVPIFNDVRRLCQAEATCLHRPTDNIPPANTEP